MNDRLELIRNIKKTIIYLDKIIENFPNREIVLIDQIKRTSYDMLELSYIANTMDENKRKPSQTQIIVKLKMLDFYLKLACDKKYISFNKYSKIGEYLVDIIKQINGWIKSSEKV